MFDFLKPKTVKSILANIYKQIDELEIVAEQNELLFDQAEQKILDLEVEKSVFAGETERAERVAAKLRSLIEI